MSIIPERLKQSNLWTKTDIARALGLNNNQMGWAARKLKLPEEITVYDPLSGKEYRFYDARECKEWVARYMAGETDRMNQGAGLCNALAQDFITGRY